MWQPSVNKAVLLNNLNLKKELSSRMNQFVKSVLVIGITSALNISLFSHANAATYNVVDQGEPSQLKYTYAQHQNSAGDMAISGTNIYNFPVQFSYFDDNDFTAIQNYVTLRYLGVNGLEDIEDIDALKAGNPTANDLAWVVRWLQDTSSGKGLDIEYQKVGDSIAMSNIAGNTTDLSLWDTSFSGSDTLTRSTVDILSGITDSGTLYGTATAPYLPSEPYTDSNDNERTFWLRTHGMRGFFSYDLGATVLEITPFETEYAGGTSAILDVNEAGTAVGFSSYKVAKSFDDVINDDTGGCTDPDVVPASMTLEACIAEVLIKSSSAVYHTMALKAALSPNGAPVTEQLGLLVTPHADDERTFSSYALAINSEDVAVGYADGFYDETVTEPEVNERVLYHYAVVYKDGEVIDLSGDHTDRGSSRAYDINDAGIAVGHIAKSISGKAVNKFFHVDTTVNKAELNMITPDDFFNGSDSTARAINNNGLIVGEGEIETHNESSTNPRRTAAFIYNLNDNTFTNLNDLIPCSIRQTYDIIEARGINDAGVISATAVVETTRRDAKGEVMRDENDNPLTEDVVRAISITPMPDDGEICTAEEEGGKLERKGASVGFGSALFIMTIFGLRRRFFN